MKKKDGTYTLSLSPAERGLLIAALNEFRNKRIEEGKPTELADGVFMKLVGK